MSKATQTTPLPEGGKVFLPTRQDFMYIRLMPHVPHDLVLGQIKDIMKRHSKLHDT